ncbi:SDR family NAD(P)-dependent oxidoreductase [Streptomyces sp. NPDC059690]|uniref:SDR family NAD(P)-dependent oxidoreductase n=1 Tax=Streptomyces sp. NPDC059690 TaxID=3346907 RepID=UPI0036917C6E
MTEHRGETMQPNTEAAADSEDEPISASGLRAALRQLVSELCGVPQEEIDAAAPLATYGLTSRAAVDLAGRLERLLKRPLPATLVWEHPTMDRLVQHLCPVPQDAVESGEPRACPEQPLAEGLGPDNDRVRVASSAPCPVAVVGIGCRLPGGISGADTFWRHLLTGSDLTGQVPSRRWRDFATGPGAAKLVEDTTRHGAFLHDIEAFDADYFGITPREAEVMDPQQRLLLEVCCEALDHAGVPAHGIEGTTTGVFVGLSALEYGHLTTSDPSRLTPWTSTGAAGSIAANRLSYVFDLHGPSLTIDTACSSSLVALHHACRSLGSGECDTALAAGVNVLLSPLVTASFEQAGALAADGRCKPFDSRADGITRGEGCGVVVLKRLADAQRAGDRILAVIKGTAVNSDGRSAGLMAPNPAAQESLLRTALDHAQVEADSIDYVETHGTGTLLGDPMEASALGAVLGRGRPVDQPLLIGSVKSNLGHLEGAAGIVGLIKTVLALHHQRIPQSLHFHTPNPHIDFPALRLRVVTAATPWPERPSRPARAGVSAFGFGGTNAHVVLEQAPGTKRVLPAPGVQTEDGCHDGPHVLIVSARSTDRIADAAAGLARLTAAEDAPALVDLAHTLARHRRGPQCAAVTARTGQDAAALLAALARGEELPGIVSPPPDDPAGRSATRRPVFVFSGYGSQWQGMGRRLLQEDRFFAAAVRDLDPVYLAETGVPFSSMLTPSPSPTHVDHVQPLLFGMQIALARTLEAYGVRPAAVIGHSMGEVSAAVTAGALDLADALRVILRRSEELAAIDAQGLGAMAAVELPLETRAAVLARHPGVDVAVHSSPLRCTVAGPAQRVQALVEELVAQGVFARLLEVAGAGHSPAVDPVLPRVHDALATLRPRRADLPWYTTVHEDPRADVHADADYWCANLRRPVRLYQAVEAAAADGHDLFLEISPHPIALVPLNETLHAHGAPTFPLLRKEGDETVDLRTALTRLHLAGVHLNEDRLWPVGTRVALPTPAWRHKRYWFGRPGRASAAPGDSHGLLGTRTDDPRDDTVLWQTDLGAGPAPAPESHLHGCPVLTLPAAAAIMIAAAREAQDCDASAGVRIEDLALHGWLPIAGSTPVTLVWEPGEGDAVATINARATDGTWHRYASARVRVLGEPPEDTPEDTPGTQPALTSHWAPTTEGESASRAVEEALTAVLYAPAGTSTADAHDAVPGIDPSQTVPVAVHRMHVHHLTADGPLSIQAHPTAPKTAPSAGAPAPPADTLPAWNVVASGSETRITAEGVQLHCAERAEVPEPLDAFTYEIQWQKSPAPLPGRLDSALVLSDEASARSNATVTTALHAALKQRRVQTTAGTYSEDHTDQVLADWLAGTESHATRAVVLLLPAQADQAEALQTAAQVARHLASNAPATPPRLWLVTERAVSTSQAEAGVPNLACLRGLVRVLCLEEPGLRASLVDLDMHPGSADDLVQELLGDSLEDEVVWRLGTRLVARLTRADLTEQQHKAPFVRRSGAYIITGGLTGLGLATARRLAGQGAGRLILNGRRPPSPEAQQTIAEISGGATSITVVQGDIADPEVAARLVDSACSEGHSLRGIAHCAGVLHDRMITDLAASDIDTVLRPKVEGALQLEKALGSHALDWWVSYSSAAALLGSPGQAAYAAANAWLDALAHQRRAQGKPALSIAWGPWRDTGAAPAQRGMALEGLSLSEGLDALHTLIVRNRTHTGVVHFDTRRVLEAFPGMLDIPFFYETLTDDTTAGDDWAGPDSVAALGADAAAKVFERLVKRTAAIMGFSVADLDETAPLPALGLDSLMAVRIRNAVQQDFAVTLPTDLMLRGATLREVADALLSDLGLGADDEQAPPPPESGPTCRPHPVLPSTIQPRDAAERLVASTWTEVLHSPPSDVRADFVTAGGDRGTAEQLVKAIQRRVGDDRLDITAADILEQRTVAGVADLIRPAVNPAAESVITTLRKPARGTAKAPLFTFHPAGGPTSVYRPLTELLPPDQPVYGMERISTLDTMEEKAAHYLGLVKDIQPRGPVQLLGWSFGGCLAYEVAQQLRAAGEDIAFLGLVDTILPAALPGLHSQDVLLERFGRFAEYVRNTYGHDLQLPYDELAATPEDQQIDLVMRLVAESGLDMSPGIMEHQRTSYLDARVGERYTPRPYNGPVVLYRAQQAQQLTTALDPRYLRSEADLGWGPLCSALEIVPVEGDHLSLIDPPHVATIARHLTQSLRSVGHRPT